jgi:hypothetical protein
MNPQSAGFFATLRMTIGKAQNDKREGSEWQEGRLRMARGKVQNDTTPALEVDGIASTG